MHMGVKSNGRDVTGSDVKLVGESGGEIQVAF